MLQLLTLLYYNNCLAHMHALLASTLSRISHDSCSALIPVSRYYGWHGVRRRYVLPVEVPTSQSVDDKEGVYDFAQEGGEVAEIFGEFCRKNLCMESWEFIRDSVVYKVPSGFSVNRRCGTIVHHKYVAQRKFKHRMIHRESKHQYQSTAI